MVEHDWNPSIPETGVGARKAPGQLRLQNKLLSQEKNKQKAKRQNPSTSSKKFVRKLRLCVTSFTAVLSQYPHQCFKGPCQFLLYLFSLEK